MTGLRMLPTRKMARENIDIFGISELKWTGMGEFNSDDHYIYYCGQESLRRNGVAIISSVTHSCLTLCNPHGLQHSRSPCPSPTPGAYSNSCPSHWWCHPSISHHLSSPSPPTFNLSQHQGLFKWISSLHQAAKVLEFQLQCQFFQWTSRTDFL